ncbi:MAG: ribonuclease III [Deltaproteobacteria bacterium RBG_16_49_23]|nr:MAG: ribonuclease III [Deltaproteobacteria bacterium RBG_16_49_23]
MDEERLTSLREMEERLGYQFKERVWLDQALTHKSFIHQTNAPNKVSNEVLEYLGDAVLNLAVSHLLLKEFPEAQEGTLSMWRSHLVKRSSLAFFSKQLRLDQYLLFGKSEILDGGAKKASILANAYEAVIGAIYMDSGYDQALEIVRNHLEPYLGLENFALHSNDYKSLLQKYAQKAFGFTPQYHVLKESGPEHDKQFQASVMIGEEIKGTGWGGSKKLAEQEAAKNALKDLNANDQTLNIK